MTVAAAWAAPTPVEHNRAMVVLIAPEFDPGVRRANTEGLIPADAIVERAEPAQLFTAEAAKVWSTEGSSGVTTDGGPPTGATVDAPTDPAGATAPGEPGINGELREEPSTTTLDAAGASCGAAGVAVAGAVCVTVETPWGVSTAAGCVAR